MRIRRRSILSAIACVFMVINTAGAALASDKTCEEEMPEIAALISGIPNGADKNVAEHQYEKAQKFLAEGNERRCLLYLQSARAAVDAEMMHNN